MLIDSHCHFDFSVFDQQRESIWQACLQADIKSLIIPAVEPASLAKIFTINRQYTGIYGAAGLHPWWVDQWLADHKLDDLAQSLLPGLTQPTCVAVGECGLDALIKTPVEIQLPVFERQLQLACEFDLPVIIHARKTHNEVIELLKKYRPVRGGVIYGFTGSIELAQTYWQLGFYLGVGGAVTYPRATKTRKAIVQLPLEALLLETDAPDMPLHNHQGKTNSPLCLPEIARCLAQLRGQSFDRICHQTSDNSRQFFQI